MDNYMRIFPLISQEFNNLTSCLFAASGPFQPELLCWTLSQQLMANEWEGCEAGSSVFVSRYERKCYESKNGAILPCAILVPERCASEGYPGRVLQPSHSSGSNQHPWKWSVVHGVKLFDLMQCCEGFASLLGKEMAMKERQIICFLSERERTPGTFSGVCWMRCYLHVLG